MTYDDIEQSKEDAHQIDIERQREIDEHEKYLASKFPIYKLESMFIDLLQSKLENRQSISKLFDDDVNFQDWITSVRDEFCRRIAEADLKDYYHDRY